MIWVWPIRLNPKALVEGVEFSDLAVGDLGTTALIYLFIYFIVFQTGSHATQAGLKLDIQPRMSLKYSSI